jgi:hypothetical protein
MIRSCTLGESFRDGGLRGALWPQIHTGLPVNPECQGGMRSATFYSSNIIFYSPVSAQTLENTISFPKKKKFTFFKSRVKIFYYLIKTM